MNVTTDDLTRFTKWIGRRVVLLANTPAGTQEFDGELKAVHAQGIMMRPRGRQTPEMAKMDDIVKLELFDDMPKPIESKRMTHVIFGKIRQHLADQHGFALDELNLPDFTESRALDVHDEEHHPSADRMSHFHEG